MNSSGVSVERFLRSWLTKEGAILVPVDLKGVVPIYLWVAAKENFSSVHQYNRRWHIWPTYLLVWLVLQFAGSLVSFVYFFPRNFQDGRDGRHIKVILQKGTKPWSKINSHVNNMYFTLKSSRYVALSFRHGGWRRKRTGAVGKSLRSRFSSRFCTLLCQNQEGRQEFSASKIKRLLVMLFEFSFADFTIFSRIS